MVTTAPTTTQTPTKGQREAALLVEVERLLESIWRLNIYENEADVAHEVMDAVHEWGHRYEDELTRHAGATFAECEYRIS